MKSLLVIFILSVVSICVYAQQKATVEKFAEFPGGADKFYNYIKKGLKYPADALKDKIQGDVHVTFIVTYNGTIVPGSIQVVKGLTPSCDAEAIRIIKGAPAWTPGKGKEPGALQSTALEQQITFPVSFVIE
ncbi:MAG TPA: TonB family protein [Chryseolinea sp.]|nr:TonB family protein [Chryseolinea sp.]